MMENQPRSRSLCVLLFSFIAVLFVEIDGISAPQPFTLKQVLSAPFPSELTAAKNLPRIAWVLDEQGKRNIYVAEAPDFKARRLTAYREEDGQELSELQFSDDGGSIVYTRGGGKNHAGQSANPTSSPAGVEQAVYRIAWRGGEPQKIDAGHSPELSRTGICAYVHDGQLWLASLGSSEKPVQLVVRGVNFRQRWSPDGSKLAFTSDRGDHSFIGVYDVANKSIRFVAPTVDSDARAEWSPDGKELAFIRQPALPRDTPEGYFIAPDRPHPWAIWVADATTGTAREVWRSGAALVSSYPYMAQET